MPSLMLLPSGVRSPLSPVRSTTASSRSAAPNRNHKRLSERTLPSDLPGGDGVMDAASIFLEVGIRFRASHTTKPRTATQPGAETSGAVRYVLGPPLLNRLWPSLLGGRGLDD